MLILDYVIPILSLLLGIALLGVSIYALVKIAATFRGIIQEIKDFFSPQAEGQLSAFGEVISFIAKAIGIQVAQSFNQVIAGSIGGTVKGANAELQEQFAKDNPEAAMQMAFNDMLPKSYKKNKVTEFMLNRIFSMAMNSVGNKNNGSTSTASTDSPKFKL